MENKDIQTSTTKPDISFSEFIDGVKTGGVDPECGCELRVDAMSPANGDFIVEAFIFDTIATLATDCIHGQPILDLPSNIQLSVGNTFPLNLEGTDQDFGFRLRKNGPVQVNAVSLSIRCEADAIYDGSQIISLVDGLSVPSAFYTEDTSDPDDLNGGLHPSAKITTYTCLGTTAISCGASGPGL